VDVSIPRDRKGEFEPQLLKKNQTSISPDIEEKILSMYAKGMSTRDIEAHSTYFKYPQEIRRLIYTTNTIEGFNRQLRKVTKAKSVFPTDDSLLKMLYLAMMEITRKWTGRRQDWNIIRAQLAVYFAERMPD
jgi:transposase-like protein